MDKERFEKQKKVIYEFICDDLYVPMKIKEIAVILSVPKSRRGELEEVLSALMEEGKIAVSKKGRYFKSKANTVSGTFISHARGYGFVVIEGEAEDIFIPKDKVNGAFHQDTVQVCAGGRDI